MYDDVLVQNRPTERPNGGLLFCLSFCRTLSEMEMGSQPEEILKISHPL